MTLPSDVDGPGSPAHLMQVRLGQLLRRLRNTVAFPMPIDTFLFSVYPEQLFQPIPNRVAAPWDNLAACMNTGEIAHFSVDGRGENETFWVRHPKGEILPVPADASTTLRFDELNPHFTLVSKWLDTALAVQEDIVSLGETASAFIRSARHPKHVEYYWPELYAFVAAALEGRIRDPIPKINTRALERPVIQIREEVTTLLAKCSLLPDNKCQAWVQYPREDS